MRNYAITQLRNYAITQLRNYGDTLLFTPFPKDTKPENKLCNW